MSIGFGKTTKIQSDSDPALYAEAVTPNDSADLTNPGWLHVGTAGTVKVDTLGGSTGIEFSCEKGTQLPVLVKKVYATGTDADDLVVCY